jgi:hypothetical protein
MGYPWPDQVRRGDRIRASHVTTLRNEIKHQGDLAGLNPPITWSPPSINSGDPILAIHFRDMRSAIQRLWNSKNRGPLPMWSSGQHPGGASLGTDPTRIRATDITDLRRWLDAYIDNHPRMGMDTKSYDAASRLRLTVTASDAPIHNVPWLVDINALQPPTPTHFMVRCIVTQPRTYSNPLNPQSPSQPIPWNNTDRDNYATAFQLIRQVNNVVIFAVLPPEFLNIGATRDAINEELDDQFSNPAIRQWAAEVKNFVAYVTPHARDFIIWNEPNYETTELDPRNFAALMYACYNELNALLDPPRIY